jgi:hypothetical protein
MNESGCDATPFDTALLEGDALDTARYDRAFQELTGTPDWLRADLEISRVEARRRDIRRIASTVFCSSDVDPSVVSFAKYRTAAFWGMAEEQVDVLVTARLLEKAASLMADLRPCEDELGPVTVLPAPARRPPRPG